MNSFFSPFCLIIFFSLRFVRALAWYRLELGRLRKYLPPPVKEHAYELQMEKKLKRLVAEQEKKQGEKE
jgi:hypothetical protein